MKKNVLFVFACLMTFGLTSAAFAEVYPACVLTGKQIIAIESSGPEKTELVKKMCDAGKAEGYKAAYSENSKFDEDQADIAVRIGYKDSGNESTCFRKGGPVKYGANKEYSGHMSYCFGNEIEAYYIFELLAFR
jgi:hypothetical protein